MDPFDTDWVSFHCRTLLPAVQARSVTIFKTFPQEPTAERSGRTCPAVCPCTLSLHCSSSSSPSALVPYQTKESKSSCQKWKAGGSSCYGFHKCGTSLFLRTWESETEAYKPPEEPSNPPAVQPMGELKPLCFKGRCAKKHF